MQDFAINILTADQISKNLENDSLKSAIAAKDASIAQLQ
jgi:hypothetical protein